MYNDYFGFRVAPFSLTPDPEFYYTNPVYEESLATLQYGVTEKKGLIVITGEVGTGKTTLLHKLLRSLKPTVDSVFIFNTQITFEELFRLILADLGLTSKIDDRLTMIETLNHYLIERVEQGHIVCLLIDEAQNLSYEALEGLRLLSNLETDKEKLLQIVLMGQPDLEKKLEQPELRQLKQRVTLYYRLPALQKREIAPYINFRLKTAGYHGNNLFRPDAFDQIALCSNGIPRLINIICDNALLTAYAESKREVSAEMIKEVAVDLRLSDPTEAQMPPADSPTAREPREAVPDAQIKIVPDEVWRSRLGLKDFPAGLDNAPMKQRKKSWARFRVAALLVLLFIGGGGAFGYSERVRSYLSDLRSNLRGLIEDRSADNIVYPQQQEDHNSSTQTDATASAVLPTEGGDSELPSVPEPRDPNAGQASVATTNDVSADKPRKTGVEKRPVAKEPPRSRASNIPDLQKKRLELEVEKAIQNRAINGVTVSLIDGTTYLDGEVATESQKSMAERAARSVPQVDNVKNRLTVKTS